MKLSQTRAPTCVSDLLFDRRLAGELDEAETRALESHVKTCARCTERWGDLAADYEKGGMAPLPPSIANAEVGVRLGTRRRGAGARALAAMVAAVAAAIVAVMLLRVAPPSQGERSKGGAQLSFHVRHESAVRLGGADERVAPGDALRFSYTTREETYLVILSVDGAGAANAYYPDGAWAARIEPGQAVPLPSSTVLDGVLGAETIYGLFCDAPLEIEPLRRALQRAPMRPPAAPGCTVDALRIRKEPANP